MIKRTPQEIADFFGCHIVEDSNSSWLLFQEKPVKIESAKAWDGDYSGRIFQEIVDVPEIHHWRKLYEPNLSVSPTGSVGIAKNTISTGAPHQSNVYLHPEEGNYRTVTGYTLPEFDNKVYTAMQEGWKPVSMTVHSFEHYPKVIFYMAMVRGI